MPDILPLKETEDDIKRWRLVVNFDTGVKVSSATQFGTSKERKEAGTRLSKLHRISILMLDTCDGEVFIPQSMLQRCFVRIEDI